MLFYAIHLFYAISSRTCNSVQLFCIFFGTKIHAASFNPDAREIFNKWLTRNPNCNSEINDILKSEEASVITELLPKTSRPVLNTSSKGQIGQANSKKKFKTKNNNNK